MSQDPTDDHRRRAREQVTERYGPRDVQKIVDVETWDDFADWLAIGFANADAKLRQRLTLMAGASAVARAAGLTPGEVQAASIQALRDTLTEVTAERDELLARLSVASELDLVRDVRNLCADAVSGCRYDAGEDVDTLGDAGDDVRSLNPDDLLARVRARRELDAERRHEKGATRDP